MPAGSLTFLHWWLLCGYILEKVTTGNRGMGKSTTQIGYTNHNDQRVIRRTEADGTDHNQKSMFWSVVVVGTNTALTDQTSSKGNAPNKVGGAPDC